jgi:hypothetical protein
MDSVSKPEEIEGLHASSHVSNQSVAGGAARIVRRVTRRAGIAKQG